MNLSRPMPYFQGINRWRFLAATAIGLHCVLILMLNLFRHWGYLTSINDLGVSDQVVWGLVNGEPFLNTSQLHRPINWLGFHFHLVYIFFVPFYILYPNVIWFAAAHALSISLSAWFLFHLGCRILRSEAAGFLWLIVYLMHPTLLNSAAFDFTPITMALPFVVLAYWAVETRNLRILILSALFLMVCKEHMGAMVAGFGFLWGLRNNQWKTAAVFILIGAAHSIVILGAVMPALSDTGSHVMFGKGLDQLSRYGWLGDSAAHALWNVIAHPIHVVSRVMMEMEGLKYLTVLLVFFLGFPLAAPVWILAGSGDLAVNLLSSNPLPRSLFAFHNAILVPVLTVAAIYGVKKIAAAPNWVNRFSVMRLSAIAAAAAVVGGYFLAPLPLPGARNIYAATHFFSRPDPIVPRIRSAVSRRASVSVQANVGAHFSQRREIYCYPNKTEEATAIILRLESPTENIQNSQFPHQQDRKYILNSLDGCLQMARRDYIDSVQWILNSGRYGIRMWEDPWLVLTRNPGPAGPDTKQEIGEKLDHLRDAWGIAGRSAVSGEGAGD